MPTSYRGGHLLFRMTPSEVALKYIGQTEKPGNMGFTQREFEIKMEKVGFQKKHAWCSYFAELVFKEASPHKAAELDKLFSASAVQTFHNFKAAGYAVFDKPFVDALVIWQTQKNGQPQWTGHAGICVDVIDDTLFRSVEGNTNDKGGREGYIVALKKRQVKKVTNGLQILGFIKIA